MDKGITQMFIVLIVLMVVSVIGITVMVATTKSEVKKLGATTPIIVDETGTIAA